MVERSIDEEIRFLFKKNISIIVIARTVHKRPEYVSKFIKDNGLKRRFILKRYIKYCARCNKEIEHNGDNKYCSMECVHKHHYELFIKEWLDGNIDGGIKGGSVSTIIRRWFFEKNNSKCEKCGWSKVNPVTKKIPLTINHKDGNSLNNRPKNIELICPNCHSLTPNYGSLNKGKGREKRLQKIREKKLKINK